MNSQIRLQLQAAPGAPPAGTALLSVGVDGRFYVTLPGPVTLPVGNELTQDNGTLNINAAIATAALFTAVLFATMRAKIIAAAGGGAYAADYFLNVANLLPGASLRLMIELPASVNPTVNIFSALTGTITCTTGGTGVIGVGTNFTSAMVGKTLVNSAGVTIGIVQTVNSTTSITLTGNAAVNVTGAAVIALLKTITSPNGGNAAAYWWGQFGFGQDGIWHLDASGWN